MSCCCQKVYKLCDVVICDADPLVLPVPIPADGQYTLELDFLGDVIRRTAMLSTGDNATFDKGPLNERFTYQGRVLDPSGAVIKFTVEEVEYDCIEFTTQRAHEWTSSSTSSAA
jgi:hypothetical protein